MALVEIEEQEITFDDEGSKELAGLFHAVYRNDLPSVERILIELGANIDLNRTTKNGETLVHAAAEIGNTKILEMLISRGLDIHQLNDNCENAMHTAVLKDRFEVLRFLNERGVSMDIQNKNGEAPIHMAAKSGNMPLMEFFCTMGANANIQDREGETPLICAAARGSLDCVKILLNAGAKVNVEDRNGWTALEHAIKRHQTTIALMLINAGSKVNHVDMHRDTSLHIACREGLLPVVQALCAFGCRVDVYNGAGLTPLHIASRSGVLEIVRCLLLAGANPQLASKEGIHPEIMSLAQGHNNTASLLGKMKPEKRAICVEQLVPTARPMCRIKLKVFGAPMCGKSSLIDSLRSNYLSGFFRKKFKSTDNPYEGALSLRQRSLPSEMCFDVQQENYTRGINIQNITISGGGEMSAWEMSGYEPYYVMYDHFIGDTSCIHAVLFNLHDPYDLMRTRVMFWLNFIKARIPAREPLGFCGKPRSMAKVILIGTHADRAQGIKNAKGLTENKDAFNILHEAKKEFRYTLEICDEVFALRCTDPISPDIKALKVKLAEWRAEILKRLPNANGFLDVVASKLPEWTSGSNFPVVTWQQFVDQIRAKVNPLCSEDHLKDLIQELQYIGEVVYVESESAHDMIVLNPRWLCTDILGYLLSHENISQARVTGSFTIDDVQFMIGSHEPTDLVRILIALDLCTACRVDDETQYEFPCLNFVESYPGLWDRESRHRDWVYAGIQFHAARSQLVHLFSRIQNQLRRSLLVGDNKRAMGECGEDDDTAPYSDDEGEGCLNENDARMAKDVELNQWFHGSKLICRGGQIECLVTIENSDQVIEIKAKGPVSLSSVIFGYYQDIINLVEQVVDDMCPSLEYDIFILHPEDLKRHMRSARKIHQRHVFTKMMDLLAEQETQSKMIKLEQDESNTVIEVNEEISSRIDPLLDIVVEEQRKQKEEMDTLPATDDWNLVDLLFFSDPQLMAKVKLGPQLHISSLRTPTFQRLCLHLDPPDPMGRDWCLLAIKLGMTQHVPKYDNTNEWLRSRTAKILDEWGRDLDSTVGKLIAVLQEFNRPDTAQILIESSPLYHFAPSFAMAANQPSLMSVEASLREPSSMAAVTLDSSRRFPGSPCKFPSQFHQLQSPARPQTMSSPKMVHSTAIVDGNVITSTISSSPSKMSGKPSVCIDPLGNVAVNVTQEVTHASSTSILEDDTIKIFNGVSVN